MSIDMKSGCANPTPAAAGSSRPLGYLMALLAFLTCPCHLPIWLVLFGGSAFGAILNENLMIAAVILLALFMLCGRGAIRRLKNP